MAGFGKNQLLSPSLDSPGAIAPGLSVSVHFSLKWCSSGALHLFFCLRWNRTSLKRREPRRDPGGFSTPRLQALSYEGGLSGLHCREYDLVFPRYRLTRLSDQISVDVPSQ